MPATNVKTRWVGGDLYFYDKAENEIAHWDGTNRKLVIPSGSELDVAGVAVNATTLATSDLDADNVSEVADVNVVGGIPVLYRITAAALTGDVDVTITYKTRVLDVWCVQTAAGGTGDTIIVKNDATAITDTMDCNKSDKVITRAATIDDAQHEIADGGTLRVSGASAVTCEVYVLGLRVA